MTELRGPTTGVVTFLFSDIEGSTKLELALGTERFAVLRERHRELLRAAFVANGGREQSTQGDSFFVLFDSARSAVRAAIEGQRSLARESWPDGVEVLVRMGLHSGEALLGGGDVVGYDVNRAARIAGAAHGGQIVVSDAVRSLAGAGSDGTFELRDLGEHRLKDLLAPERLAQVVAADLRTEFPPIHSLDARPNNLPTQLTSFVGRETELEEALRLLSSTRLLTLTGPGEHLGNDRRGVDRLLEVVEDEQHAARSDGLGDAVEERPGGQLRHADHARDRRRHELAFPDGLERHEPDPVREVVRCRRGDLQRQAGLADAARSGQREQPR